MYRNLQEGQDETLLEVTKARGITAAYLMTDMGFVKNPYVFTTSDLECELELIESEVRAAKYLDLNSGEEQCKYCVRKSSCPALQFESDLEIFNQSAESRWEYLKALKLQIKGLGALEKRLESDLIELLQEGGEIPFVKLKANRRYHWNLEKLEQVRESLGLEENCFYEKEKLMKNADIESQLLFAGYEKASIRQELREEKITSWSLKEEAA